MSFDQRINRAGAHFSKYTIMDGYGIDQSTGIPMGTADSDYASAPCVTEALADYVARGGYPYGFDDASYRAAVAWWQGQRHGWEVDPDWVVTTQGLGHAIAMILEVWSEIGDGVAYFTPVYHEFRRKTLAADRRPVELPLTRVEGRYELDWERAEAAIDPGVKILLHCAPQNPSGRVWSAQEQRQIAAFAERHGLLLVSDEIHADLVYPGARHVPMDMAAPEHRARTVTISAASKTFNIPGLRTGQAIIPDPAMRAAFARRLKMLQYNPGVPGIVATQAAYSPAGLAWADQQIAYLDGNRQVFDAALAQIPGLWSMPLEATFLAWVDFAGTGMEQDEIRQRIRAGAGIVSGDGPGFGTGGETFQRFNFAMPRAQVEEAGRRLQAAFADLQ